MNRILPVVLIVAALALVFGYVRPTYDGSITAKQEKSKSYDAALAAAQSFSQKEAALVAAKNALPADALARLEAYLPDGVNNVALILDLNALAARSGLALSNFDVVSSGAASTPSALANVSPVDSVDLSLTATGSYGALQSFLRGAEQSLRLLDLTSLSLADSPTGVYTYQMVFRIYWLR